MLRGLPIIAINPIPGQEEENAEVLEEMGVAMWVKQKDNFEQVVRDILESKMLETLKQNTIRFSKANSSEEICKIIFNEYKNE